jgi:hypothetical protein
MIRTEMLLKLRNFVDEASQDFYDDGNDLYPALAEAQRELLLTVANVWREKVTAGGSQSVPKVIQTMINKQTATLGIGLDEITVTDMIVPISMVWNPDGTITNAFEGDNCIYINTDKAQHILRNSLLEDGFYFWLFETNGLQLNPKSANSNATYILDYIQEIANDIDASNDPELDEVGHDAIIERACWILLKDRESDQAQIHLQLYGQLLQGLVR